MFEIIKPGTQIDFMSKRRLWVGISVVAIIASVVLLFTKGLNFGIDFSGGAEIQVRVPAQWDTGMLRERLSTGGVEGFSVVQIGDPSAHEFLIRVKGEDEHVTQITSTVQKALSQSLQPGEFEITRSDIVGPAAGSLLRKRGFLAMLYSLLVILVYVAVRFDARYAPGAVIALLHDTMVVLGVFVLTGRQFDLTILAAILALIGYSNNDTIIVFDRVRETVQLKKGLSIEQIVNVSVNETLGRTLITSVTAFVVALSLFFFGGPVIEGFAFTLICGIVVGTYSSIFVASSLVVWLVRFQENRKNRGGSGPKQAKKKKNYDVRPDPNSVGV